MASDSIAAITASLPPETDYLTYLTILESHLSPEILPTLNELLQDATLTQNIGWDLIQLLTPLPGAEACLNTIARLGNPREVVLKVTEALRLLNFDEEDDEEDSVLAADSDKVPGSHSNGELADISDPTRIDKFCTLVSLLATLHPRIKTKYPSRFLSTSLIAVLSSYRPSDKATSAVIAFLHSLSGKKRPPLPQRKSSMSVTTQLDIDTNVSAPDPEATAEEPQEGAIQKKLLQSFVTHILEVYINENRLEWTARLQEHFEPDKIVIGRKPLKDAFKNDIALVNRDMIVGQLVAVARDLGLSEGEILFDAIYAESKLSENDIDEEHPTSPEDVPLSKAGSLYLVAYFIFSSIIFDANAFLPPMSLFPGHAKLIQQFIGINDPTATGSEETATIDSVLAIGLWLEKSNKFVSGPLEDEDFLQYLQTLSLLSANTPDSNLRYGAHILLSLILHAHPTDRIRLTFIVDTLENCPYETLRASAVGWLKEELIQAHDRKSENIFSSTVALASAQPYLFPDTSALAQATDREAWDEFRQSFPFHMAVLNFLYFIRADTYANVVPASALSVAEEIYVGPLRATQARLHSSLQPGGEVSKGMDEEDVNVALAEVDLFGQRIEMSAESTS